LLQNILTRMDAPMARARIQRHSGIIVPAMLRICSHTTPKDILIA
jgi:hypothetical protein